MELDNAALAGYEDFQSALRREVGEEYLEDLATHGAAAGFPTLTYYSDTVAWYERFEIEIWEALNEDAQSFGYENALALIATFGGAENVDDEITFKNLLVWYMAEREAERGARR